MLGLCRSLMQISCKTRTWISTEISMMPRIPVICRPARQQDAGCLGDAWHICGHDGRHCEQRTANKEDCAVPPDIRSEALDEESSAS